MRQGAFAGLPAAGCRRWSVRTQLSCSGSSKSPSLESPRGIFRYLLVTCQVWDSKYLTIGLCVPESQQHWPWSEGLKGPLEVRMLTLWLLENREIWQFQGRARVVWHRAWQWWAIQGNVSHPCSSLASGPLRM